MRIARVFRGIVGVVLSLAIGSAAGAQYSGGSGTADDPYQIATAADLIAVGETPDDYDKHFILTADIDLDPNLPGGKVFDRAVIAPDTNDAESGFQGTKFTGVFDGDGHTVSHLTITGLSYLGLFGKLNSPARVSNLCLEIVNVEGSGSCIGGLAGSNGHWEDEGGVVVNCHSSGMVTGDVSVGGLVGANSGTIAMSSTSGIVNDPHGPHMGNVGGLVGINCEWGSITGSCSASAVTGSPGSQEGVGGLAGANFGNIGYSYSTGAVASTGCCGGFVGINGYDVTEPWAEIFHCYSTGSVIGKGAYVGGLVGDNYHSVTECFWDMETSGLPRMCGSSAPRCDDSYGMTTAEMQTAATFLEAGWDFIGKEDGPQDIWGEPEGGGYPILWWQVRPGFGLPPYSGGSGEPNDPYLISTPEELSNIGHNPRLMRCHFRLINDIDCAGVHLNLIGFYYGYPRMFAFPYDGVFDGNGHTISNLTLIGEEEPVGLFRLLSENAKVRDLGIVSVNITGSGGGLVAVNGGTISRCWATGAIAGSYIVGGLVGTNTGSVINCYCTAQVSGGSHVGGLVGCNYGTIVDSYSHAEVRGTYYVGGLVGFSRSTVTRCYSTGVVSGVENVGGLVGYKSGTITESYSSGTVTGNRDVGGLVGASTDSMITNCYSTNSVSGGSRVGGLVGDRRVVDYGDNITNCYSTGSVSGNSYVGGLVGRFAWLSMLESILGYIESCFWDMETSGLMNMCGSQDDWRSGCDDSYGKTTAEMQDASTFLDAGWDFVGETENGTDDIWWILEGKDYPSLWWELIDNASP